MSALSKASPLRKDLQHHWAWSNYWGWCYLFFFLMNVSSIPAHNFLKPSTPFWALAWRIDALATGLCSLNIAMISIEMILEQRKNMHEETLERRASGRHEVFFICFDTAF
jgi:hypothetical protein